MKRKLYWTKAMESVSKIVENVLNAFVSLSEFRKLLFLAIVIAGSGGDKVLDEKIDIMI